MTGETSLVREIVDSVADGQADVDWQAAESKTSGESTLVVLRHLRLLAKVSEAHRTPEAIVSGEELANEAFALSLVQPQLVVEEERSLQSAGHELRFSVRPPQNSSLRESKWGHLRIVERIGGGSFGDVYRAVDTRLNREVALKLLRQTSLHGVETDELLREAQALARVTHPNVVAIHGAEVRDGQVGLWMEFVRGETLEQLLDEHGPFSAREAALIADDLCSALSVVHASGIVHRDIKTQNVMRAEGGRIVLMDFGAGCGGPDDMAATHLMGTPAYLAPEVLDGEDASVRSDVYSLGVLLFRLVTHRFPVTAETLDALATAHRSGDRISLLDARPDLPEAFVRAVEKALDPDPLRRHPTVGQLRRELAAPAAGVAGAIGFPRIPALIPIVLIALTVAGLFISSWKRGALAPSSASSSVAVMPLEVESPDDRYLADGITKDIIAAVGGLKTEPVLRVPSWESSSVAFGAGISPAAVAEQLQVRHFVTGTVRRGPRDSIEISVSLSRLGDNAAYWTQLFSGSTSTLGLARLRKAIATALAGALGVVAEPPSPPTGGDGPAAIQAQEEYYRGATLLDNDSVDNVRMALEHFKRAVAFDPSHAPAYAGMAKCYLWLGNDSETATVDQLAPSVRHSLDRALLFDDDLVDARALKATFLFEYEWDWEGAEAEFRHALDLNASHEYALYSYAAFLASRNRIAEAVTTIEAALSINPTSLMTRRNAGAIYRYAGQLEQSVEHYRAILGQVPTHASAHYGLGRTLRAMGRFEESIGEFESTGYGRRVEGEILQSLALMGRRLEAERRLQSLLTDVAQGNLASRPEQIAYVYAALGRPEDAIDWLTKAFDWGGRAVTFVAVDERLTSLRTNPRFQALTGRLQMPAPSR